MNFISRMIAFKNKLEQNVTHYIFLINIFNQLSSFLLFFYAARIINSKEFGIVILFSSFIDILFLLINSGDSNLIHLNNVDIGYIFKRQLKRSVFIIPLILVVTFVFQIFFKNEIHGYNTYLLFAFLTLLLPVQNLYFNYLEIKVNFKLLTIFTFISKIGALVTTIYIYRYKFHFFDFIDIYLLFITIATFIGVFSGLIFMKLNIDRTVYMNKQCGLSTTKRIGNHSIWMDYFSFLSANSDKYLIPAIYGFMPLAIFNRISSFLITIPIFLTKAIEKNSMVANKVIILENKVSRILVLLVLVYLVIAPFLLQNFIHVIWGESYSYSSDLITLTILWSILSFLSDLYYPYFLLNDKFRLFIFGLSITKASSYFLMIFFPNTLFYLLLSLIICFSIRIAFYEFAKKR